MFESDRARDGMPEELIAALRRPMTSTRAGGRAAAVASIMDAVRRAPAPTRRPGVPGHLTLRPAPPRWARRRGMLSPVGALLAACVTLVVTWLGAIGDAGRVRARETIADSAARVVPAVAHLVRPGVIRDSLLDASLVVAIADTLRVVHFVLEAPRAAQVALVGDFTRWDTNAVALHREGARWAADVAVRGGRHRYGFVVDETRWIAATPARAAEDTI